MQVAAWSLLWVFLVGASATGPRSRVQDHSLPYLLGQIHSSRPRDADPVFDCSWRRLALSYAPKLQNLSAGSLRQLHDALELERLCGEHFERSEVLQHQQQRWEQQQREQRRDITIYVSPSGDDASSGELQAPLRSLAAAVQLMRQHRGGRNVAAAILLRGGVHYLQDTVVLGADDSNLTIAAHFGEEAIVSGGRLIKGLSWQPWERHAKVQVAQLSEVQRGSLPRGVPALRVDGKRATRARYPNANPELDLFPKGYITEDMSKLWRAPVYPPYNKPDSKPCDPTKLCGESQTIQVPVPGSEWHGMYQNFSQGYGGYCEVLDPPHSPWCSAAFYQSRQFPECHTRAPSGLNRAPDFLPNGPHASVEGAHVFAWRPGHWYTWIFEVGRTEPLPGRSGWHVAENTNAISGLVPTARQNSSSAVYLGDFDDANSCWRACIASRTQPCIEWAWHHPMFAEWGRSCYMTVGPMSGSHPLVPEDGITSGIGPQNASEAFLFTAGGNHGGEGMDYAAEWFVDNLLEELDSPNEFFFDSEENKLYFYPNGSDPLPPSEVVVPTLANLIELRASQAAPIRGVTVQGLQFVDTRPTYMDPRGNPSGGDWSLERSGAVFLEGTEECVVEANNFHHLDGNALFLSGYNRRAVVKGNEFSWLGQNAIASWGYLDGDGNAGVHGNQPRGTFIEGNFAHELGHIQKQSSFYFQAITAQTTLQHNIAFNLPRAAINFNDGFGGGNVMTRNLLFNTCRESSDHGAFNSWDRLPYITDVGDATNPSTIPAWNEVYSNFIVANYAADGGCLDNDDGSSYYKIHHNFCVYGGHKSDFDGNSKISSFNLHVYPEVYGKKCFSVAAQSLPPRGYAEGYIGNTCILKDASALYLDIGGIAGPPEVPGQWPPSRTPLECLADTSASFAALNDGLLVANNTIYVPSGQATIHCDDKMVDLAEFQKKGYDKGTIVSANMPSNDTIIGWAAGLLGMQGLLAEPAEFSGQVFV